MCTPRNDRPDTYLGKGLKKHDIFTWHRLISTLVLKKVIQGNWVSLFECRLGIVNFGYGVVKVSRTEFVKD